MFPCEQAHRLIVRSAAIANTIFFISLQFVIRFICYWFQPLIAGSLLHIFMIGQMLEPRVLGGSMPVLDSSGDGDDGARSHLDGFLSPFLIPAATRDADEHLHGLVVDVPVVTASRLKGDVMHAANPR